MFGYVKPVNAELLVKEYEFYKATYCGVCRSMKAITGGLSNILHSYDSVFLALVRMLFVEDSDIGVRKARCIAHPVKKKAMIKRNEATDYTARAFAILTYYKLCDDIADEKLLRRILTGALRPVYSGARRRANISSLADMTAKKLEEITILEKEMCPSIDKPASIFGEILGEMFSFGLDGANKRITYACGYHLGKFIYAADAAEDYDKDRSSGSYNPYVIAYGGEPLTDGNRATIKCALLLECREIEAAANLLPYGRRAVIENIINNIIYLGLPKRIEFLDDANKSNEDSAVSEGEELK